MDDNALLAQGIVYVPNHKAQQSVDCSEFAEVQALGSTYYRDLTVEWPAPDELDDICVVGYLMKRGGDNLEHVFRDRFQTEEHIQQGLPQLLKLLASWHEAVECLASLSLEWADNKEANAVVDGDDASKVRLIDLDGALDIKDVSYDNWHKLRRLKKEIGSLAFTYIGFPHFPTQVPGTMATWGAMVGTIAALLPSGPVVDKRKEWVHLWVSTKLLGTRRYFGNDCGEHDGEALRYSKFKLGKWIHEVESTAPAYLASVPVSIEDAITKVLHVCVCVVACVCTYACLSYV